MKHVSILVPERAVLASIDDPRYIFTAVNEFLAQSGKSQLFDIQLVALGAKDIKLHNERFTVHADAIINDVKKTDLIIIPAIYGDIKSTLELNDEFVPWILGQYDNGAEVVSLCSGAFFLAHTGLLKGKSCSTHWMHTNNFRRMFPEVNLVAERIITDENGIYTSGGANSYWNLLLYLVEKYVNREMAILASKYFVVEFDRNSQSPFTIFNGQKEHEDDAIIKAQEFIERNFQEKISVDQLSGVIALGRRSLERRFKKATSNTVSEYIQRVKIEAAKKSFETSRKNINEVMYEVGYADTKAFRDVFRKITGMSPVEYRNKYNKGAVVFI